MSEFVVVHDDAPPGDKARLFTAWLADLIRSGDLTSGQIAEMVYDLRAALGDDARVAAYAGLLNAADGVL